MAAALARHLAAGKPRELPRLAVMTALALAAAAAGQIYPRLHYGMGNGWDLAPLIVDWVHFPDMLLKGAALFGPALAFLLLKPKAVPLSLRCLSLVLPLTLLCYALVYRANPVHEAMLYPFKEMRALIVVVPCLWPTLALAFDRLFADAGSGWEC